MSTNPVFTVHCDEGTPVPPALACAGWVAQEETIAAAHAVAKGEGWFVSNRNHAVCPACRPPVTQP